MPITPTAFQAFAVLPDFLDLVWNILRPLARTQEFFVLADRLRADAYTRCYTYFAVPDLRSTLEELEFSRGAQEEITASVEMLNHGSAIVLLLLSVLLQSFEGPVGQERACERPAIRPVYALRPALMIEDTAPPEVQRIFDDVRKTLKIQHVNVELRVLARWPEFFATYWRELKKAAQSPLYEVCFRGVHETAFSLTREIPVVIELPSEKLNAVGMSENEIASVLHLTDSFVTTTVATVLNVAFAKIGMEGGKQAERTQPEQVA